MPPEARPAEPRPARAMRRSRPCVGSGQEGQDLAAGAFPPGGLWQRQVRLDLVAVAAAVFLLDDVAGLGPAGDDAAGAALGDAPAGRDVAPPAEPPGAPCKPPGPIPAPRRPRCRR